MHEDERSSAEPGLPPALRSLGWGVLAAAPILLAALATAVSRPSAPGRLVSQSAWAALLAGGLAAVAALLHTRGAHATAKRVAALAVVVVIGFSAFLVWLASRLA
ncbi:MAG: hypothetical protein AB8I08_10860 [Sandaracinaceae bacterium]